MARKYLKLRKILIPTMAILILTSQMCGCSSVEQSENKEMLESNEFIEVTVPELMTEEEIASMESTETQAEEESTGEAIINRAEEQTDSEQTESEITASNGQLDSTINEEELPDENRYYIKKNADGSRTYSKQLISDCLGSSTFEGLTEEEVIKILDAYFPDSTIGQDDSYYREELGYMDKELAYSSLGKDLPDNTKTDKNNQQATNQTSTNQNTSTTKPATDNVTQTPPPVTSQPETDPWLTPEQQAAIRAENEASGWLADFYKETPGHHSGESWNGMNSRD